MASITQIVIMVLNINICLSIRHASRASSTKPGRTIIYVEDERPIIIPKSRPMGPLGYKFYTDLSKINKKPPSKSVNHTPVRFKLVSGLKDVPHVDFDEDYIKKCCGNEWVDVAQEVAHYNVPEYLLLGTSHRYGYYRPLQQYSSGNSEDIKPVTEHIEDDLKYDFRTNMHSL